MDTLEHYVLEGLRAGEAVLAIANVAHRGALRARIDAAGLDSTMLAATGRYLALDAAGTLSQIMVAGWPDEARFERVMGGAIAQASRHVRRVRAFGEMVALLWGQGLHQPAVRLEEFWHRLCKRRQVAVLCGYPRFGSARGLNEAIADVCTLHSQVRNPARDLETSDA